MTRTQYLTGLDKKYIWHPFTQMKEWLPKNTIVIESGKGSYLRDTNGKRYLDGVSSLWCNVHGHRVPQIDKALRDQINKIAHSTFLGLSNVPAIQLSQRLIQITPANLKKAFFSDSGAESVEIALKMAYQYWHLRGNHDKNTFLRLSNAYHGDTIGSVSVGGIDLFHGIFKKLLFKSFHAKAPDRYHEGFNGTDAEYAEVCASRIEKVLRKHSKNISAIIMEPLVQGAAGIIVQPKGFLPKVRSLADKYGVLLILDEVATGFGRTGTMFACDEERVKPDILCLAKGLTAGYLPLAVTLTTDDIYKAFLGKYSDFKAFFHGHTYTANPLACSAALANLDYFKEKSVIEKNKLLIKHLTNCLNKFKDHTHIGDVRQKGLMAGIELIKDKQKRIPYPAKLNMGARVTESCRKMGVIIRPLGNVAVLMPPYCFTRKQISKLCNTTYDSIDAVAGGAKSK
jgi:adenosylmethionine-8-amino-7-oxononanoate aminotransferase